LAKTRAICLSLVGFLAQLYRKNVCFSLMREARYLQHGSEMSLWPDMLDRQRGVRPEIMFIGDMMVFVLHIAADTTDKAGVQLVLRCYENDVVSAAIEPDVRQRPIR
jgi:hypothetical protein